MAVAFYMCKPPTRGLAFSGASPCRYYVGYSRFLLFVNGSHPPANVWNSNLAHAFCYSSHYRLSNVLECHLFLHILRSLRPKRTQIFVTHALCQWDYFELDRLLDYKFSISRFGPSTFPTACSLNIDHCICRRGIFLPLCSGSPACRCASASGASSRDRLDSGPSEI